MREEECRVFGRMVIGLSENRQHLTSARRERAIVLIMQGKPWIDAKRMEDGRMEIRRMGWLFIRESADFVTGSVKEPLRNAGSGEGDRVAVRIVITTATAVDLGRATELGEQDDECFIEEAPLF